MPPTRKAQVSKVKNRSSLRLLSLTDQLIDSVTPKNRKDSNENHHRLKLKGMHTAKRRLTYSQERKKNKRTKTLYSSDAKENAIKVALTTSVSNAASVCKVKKATLYSWVWKYKQMVNKQITSGQNERQETDSSDDEQFPHPDTPEQEIRCAKCDCSYDDDSEFDVHIREVHADEIESACEVCGSEDDVLECFKKHMRGIVSYTRRLKSGTDHFSVVTPVKCKICDVKFRTKSRLDAHQRKFHKGMKRKQVDVGDDMFLNRKQQGNLIPSPSSSSEGSPEECISISSDVSISSIELVDEIAASPGKCNILEVVTQEM